MKAMILAAAATLTLGLSSAHADATAGGTPNPNTFFTQLPGVIAKPATGSAPAATTTQGTPNGQPVQLHASQSIPEKWLYRPEPATN